MAKRRAAAGQPRKMVAVEEKAPGTPAALRDATGWVMLVCATLAAHWPALHGGLVWDDDGHITKPDLQSWHGLWRIWSELGATQQYYPLTHSAFWLEHRLWGDAVLGYHLTNIGLHALCAVLVVLLVRRLAIPGAWLAGFLFALHPVGVESVAWISEQKSTLSGVFYLAAGLAFLAYHRSPRLSRHLLASGLFVLALLSKTVTATLPGALLVVIWWQRGRVEWKRDVRPLVPWLAVGASAGLFTAWVERTYIGAVGPDFHLTLLGRCLVAGRAIWFYAGKLIWPANLTFNYPHWNIDPAEWWQYLFPAGVLAAAAGLALLARRRRGPLAAFLIFVGTLFPALGFFNVYPFRYAYVADHFQYLASLALIVPAACWLVAASGRIAPGGPIRLALLAMLPAVLGVLSWSQSGAYRDAETLYRDTLRRNPASALAHDNLGSILQQTPGRLDEAIGEYREAVRLAPQSESAHSNLGSALAQAGRPLEALPELETALKIKPDYALGHDNLGGALAQIPGGLPQAIAEFQAALEIAPDFAEAHYNLGNALVRIPGRLADAIAQYQAAIRLRPDYLAAHTNLGAALERVPGRVADAITEFEAAVRLDPDFAEGHYNLATLLVQMPNRLPDAVAEYQAAIRIEPGYLAAHTDLGGALAQLPGRMTDAAAQFQAAAQIAPGIAEVHFNLARALAQIPGREPEAIAEFESALRLKPDFPPAREALAELRRTPR